jgi:hypothetical protein
MILFERWVLSPLIVIFLNFVWIFEIEFDRYMNNEKILNTIKKFDTKNVKTEQKINTQIFFIVWRVGNWQILDIFDKIFEYYQMIFDEKICFIPNVI